MNGQAPNELALAQDQMQVKEASIGEIRDRLNQVKGQKINPLDDLDLAPMAAVLDGIYGTNTAGAFVDRGPSEEDKKNANLNALTNQLQKAEQGQVDDQIQVARLMAEDTRAREMSEQRRQDKMEDRAFRMDMLKEKLANKGSAPGAFEKKKLEGLGTKAADWMATDRDTFVTNLEKVNKAVELLSAGKDLSAPGTQLIPDFVRKMTNPDAIVARDSMQSAIQDTLRPTLGAQFTEKEGERIMSLAYNEGLGDEENARRAEQLQAVIKRKIEATDALFEYMANNNGSDRGFPYAKYGMRKVGEIQQNQNEGGKVRVSNGAETLMINRADLPEAMKDGYKEVK